MHSHNGVRTRLQILRFVLAGALNTAVGYIIFFLIYSLLEGIFMIQGIAASVVMSLIVSLAFSYQMQKRFVWKRESVELLPECYPESSVLETSHDKKIGFRKRKTIYTTYYLSVAALNVASVRLLQGTFSLDPRIGQAIFMVAGSFVSFFFLRWLFLKVER